MWVVQVSVCLPGCPSVSRSVSVPVVRVHTLLICFFLALYLFVTRSLTLRRSMSSPGASSSTSKPSSPTYPTFPTTPQIQINVDPNDFPPPPPSPSQTICLSSSKNASRLSLRSVATLTVDVSLVRGKKSKNNSVKSRSSGYEYVYDRRERSVEKSVEKRRKRRFWFQFWSVLWL